MLPASHKLCSVHTIMPESTVPANMILLFPMLESIVVCLRLQNMAVRTGIRHYVYQDEAYILLSTLLHLLSHAAGRRWTGVNMEACAGAACTLIQRLQVSMCASRGVHAYHQITAMFLGVGPTRHGAEMMNKCI